MAYPLGEELKPILVTNLGEVTTHPQPPAQFKVELDERAILLPDGKIVQSLAIYQDKDGSMAIDGVFAFNRTRRPSRLLTLSLADMGAFTAELVASVYAAKTSFMFGAGMKIAITVVANGYRLEIQDGRDTFDLFLSTGVVWRVIRGLLAAIDAASPAVEN